MDQGHGPGLPGPMQSVAEAVDWLVSVGCSSQMALFRLPPRVLAPPREGFLRNALVYRESPGRRLNASLTPAGNENTSTSFQGFF